MQPAYGGLSPEGSDLFYFSIFWNNVNSFGEYVLAEYSREGRELDYICYLVPIRMYMDKLYSLRDFPTVLS